MVKENKNEKLKIEQKPYLKKKKLHKMCKT